MACKDAAHSQEMRGSGNGRYLHGEAIKPYPRGWTRKYKTAIRERDGYRCRVCGRPQGNPAHHVHHIDYAKDNLSGMNLITVCKFCHGAMHGTKEQRSVWQRRLSLLLSV